ncbi:MAG: YraN family protein [Candidatus Omnitrophica bacterium]|nr:YraN family protein [Candidatus Omnitrophota bacterium]MBI3010398.1 YraN family protein [Candidatus Omnitrophota bacterium]
MFRRCSTHRTQLGERSERKAMQFLCSQGYKIEAKNVRFPVGEIDLIAYEGATLCFIEIRSVSDTSRGGPLATITDAKRKRLLRAAQWYLKRKASLPICRFDVVGITWEKDKISDMELIRDAFQDD